MRAAPARNADLRRQSPRRSWPGDVPTLPTMKPITNVVGFDDAPFEYGHRGDVRIVGAVCARTRLDDVLSGKVRRDGVNATDALIALVRRQQVSRTHPRGAAPGHRARGVQRR